MKNSEKLSHQEVMQTLTDSIRDVAALSPGDRNAQFHINKGKAVAQLVTAVHREEIIEIRRQQALGLLGIAEEESMKKLKPKA